MLKYVLLFETYFHEKACFFTCINAYFLPYTPFYIYTKSFMNKLKGKGDKGTPCFTPDPTWKKFVNTSFDLIHDLESLYRSRIVLNISPSILYKRNL